MIRGLAMQETRVPIPGQEKIPHSMKQLSPQHSVTEPVLWSLRLPLLSPSALQSMLGSRSHLQGEICTPQLESSPHSLHLKSLNGNKDQAEPKMKISK